MPIFEYRRVCFAILLATVAAMPGGGGARAGELVHQFTNPSFGGNAFNSSHLLGLAEIQKQHEEPQTTGTDETEADLFIRQLQSRLLSSLSQSLSTAITGSEPGTSDTIVIGDQEIFYERSLDQVRVVITNLLDGSSTTLDVPVLGGL